MMFKIPTCHFFACGAAEGQTRVNSLDGAFIAAGLGNLNLIENGSSIPPNCKLVEPLSLPQGALVPAASASVTSDIPGEVISAGVAAAYPLDSTQTGLFAHYAAPGHKEDVEAIARRLAEEGMRVRGHEIKIIHSIAVQHRVEKIGSVVAAMVFREAE